MLSWREPKYKFILDEAGLIELGQALSKTIAANVPIAVDVETTGAIKSSGLVVQHDWLLGMSFAISKYEGWYIPIAHTKDKTMRSSQLNIKQVAKILNPILSKGGTYLLHNASFDIKFLWRAGIHLFPSIWDTLIAIKMLRGGERVSNKLKDIIPHYIDLPPDVLQTFDEASEGNAAETDPVVFGIYAINDVIFTYYLYEALKPKIDTTYYKLFYEAEAPLIPILAQSELKGIRIDPKYFSQIQKPLEKCKYKIEKAMQEQYGINIGSTDQLGKLIGERFQNVAFDFKRTDKGNISTGVEVLQTILRDSQKGSEIHALVKHTLAHRKIKKAITTYVKKYPKICEQYFENDEQIDILHTNFNQLVNSGRLSSSPNVQNITRDGIISIRKGFVSRKGYKFVAADWSSAEYRLIAIASKDKKMVKAYLDDPFGADFHILTAQSLFDKQKITKEERHKGKTFNFSAVYGASEYSISKTLDCSKERAAQYLSNYYKNFAGYYKWTKDIRKQVAKQRYTETFFGRRRYCSPDVTLGMDEWWRFDAAVRELLNHIIQGTCADLLKFAMVKMTKQFAKEKLNAQILTSVHDEIVVETNEIDRVSEIMKNTMETKIDGILLPVDLVVKDTFAKAA